MVENFEEENPYLVKINNRLKLASENAFSWIIFSHFLVNIKPCIGRKMCSTDFENLMLKEDFMPKINFE